MLAALLAAAAGDALARRREPRWSGDWSASVELEAALLWLRDRTPAKAVVLAHWSHADAIAAVARRRVLAGTSAWPADVESGMARRRLLARLLFATDEEEARGLAAAYDDAYVLLDRRFPASLCSLADACRYATESRAALTAAGLRSTVAGRMVQGAALERFQRVWDSPRFVIYRAGDRGPFLDGSQKRALLELARRALTAAVTRSRPPDAAAALSALRRTGGLEPGAAPHDAQVSLWLEGRLRSSALASGAGLAENVKRAGSSNPSGPQLPPLRAEDLPSVRIQVEVSKGDYARLSPSVLSADQLHPEKAYRVRGPAGWTTSMPSERALGGGPSLAKLLARLCERSRLPSACYRGRPAETFSVESFVESAPGGPAVELAGPFPLPPALPAAEARVRPRARAAAERLLALQQPRGWLPAEVDPFTGAGAHGTDWIATGLAIRAWLAAHAAWGDPRLLAAARRSARELSSAARQAPAAVPDHYLGLALLNRMGLYAAAREGGDRAEAARLAAELDALGARDPTFGASRYSEHLSFYARAEALKLEPDADVLEALRRRAESYQEAFRRLRSEGGRHEGLEASAWLVQGFKALYEAGGDLRHAEFALELASWLADQQTFRGEAVREGAFGPLGASSADGAAAAEALAAAAALARAIGARPPEERLRSTWDPAFRWLSAMQWSPESAHQLPSEARARAPGGLREDAFSRTISLRATAHFVSAAASWLARDAGRGAGP